MLSILSDGFKKATESLQGKATLTEANLAEALTLVRKSLLEADVEYSVAKQFVSDVKEKALGEKVETRAGKGAQKVKVTPGDHFVKTCQTALEELMGPVDTSLELSTKRPATIMMVGLQGTGKTTSTGKLAKYLIRKKRKPMLVAADIYRPAAVDQLKVLGEKIGIPVFSDPALNPVELCLKSQQQAISLGCDTIIFDTAGRLTIDQELMKELLDIKQQCKPDNTLLVCDAMMGQDAVTTAKSFHEVLGLSGVVMTKLDGDARGGAALSIKKVTGAPIKFLGMGESLDKLEEFRPEGIASRILGMGDIVSLMEDFERVGEGDKEEEALRMLSGQFNFKDFYSQISTIQKMGSLKDLVAKLPMQNMIPKDANVDDKELSRIKSMIDSMTEKERLNPHLINESRALRIAKGSGRQLKDVGDLVKKFKSMQSMMGNLGKNMGGLMGKIPGMNSLSQMNQMKKMMQGGAPSMGDLASMMGGLPGGQDTVSSPVKRVDRDKVKKARKAARKNRKKNRKK